MGSSPSQPKPISANDLNCKTIRFVRGIIQENFVTIFSKSSCSYCYTVKNIFWKLGVGATIVEINLRSDMRRIQDVLQYMTGARTVPRVFIDGKCVGGCSDLKKLYQSEELKELLGR